GINFQCIFRPKVVVDITLVGLLELILYGYDLIILLQIYSDQISVSIFQLFLYALNGTLKRLDLSNSRRPLTFFLRYLRIKAFCLTDYAYCTVFYLKVFNLSILSIH